MSDRNQGHATEDRRYDLLVGINRGWRKAEMELLARIGALDSSDDVAVALMIKDFRKLLVLARFRFAYETDIHAALDRRKPGASGSAADHAEIEMCIARLEMLVGAVAAMSGASRRPALKTLYLRLSEAIGDDFARMANEEQIVRPLLQVLFNDEELAAFEQRNVARVPNEVLFDFVRIITPALDPEGRVELIARMQRYLTAERFAALMRDVIRPALTEADLRRLEDRKAA